jgi:hypothetical protein
MNNPLQSLAISLAVMQGTCPLSSFHASLSPSHTCHVIVARKVPFDDPQVLEYVRIGYIASQAIALVVYYYASSKVCINLPFSDSSTPPMCQIKAKNDQTMLKYGAYHYFVPYLSLTHVPHLSSRASKSDGVSHPNSW